MGEGAGLVRGSPYTHILGPGDKQIQALGMKSAPKKSLNGKNCCLLTSYGDTRGSNTCVLAVVWVPRKVFPRQLFALTQ